MTSRLAASCCLVIGVGSITALAATPAQTRAEASTETTLQAMRAYLSRYRTELTFVIAEERSSQHVSRQPSNTGRIK